MKIGFPLQSLEKNAMLNDFHGCARIGMFDYATKSLTEVNVEELYARSEQNNLFSVLNDLGVKVLVCNSMKPMALKYFHDMKITVYKAQSTSINTNLDLLFNGELNRFQAHEAEAASCGSSCSSCSSATCATK